MPARTKAALAARTDAVFSALADANRRALLRAVVEQGPVTATQLADGAGISRQGVAKHLRSLAEAGLVSATRDGRESRYEADLAPLQTATTWVHETEGAWATRLDRLRRKVQRQR
jgi:DNA-binding transcriptional ArsR family regulator